MLIFLLGNDGKEYEMTRHNAAWIVHSAAFPEAEWERDSYMQSYCNRMTMGAHTVIVARPTTMMNRSGEALRLLIKKHSLEVSDIIIVHDDNDIPLGQFKITVGGGAGNHNGVKSVYGVVGPDVVRVRVGIRDDSRFGPLRTFVLGGFRDSEREVLRASGDTYRALLTDIVEKGVVIASNYWNRRDRASATATDVVQ